jgi:hypothetical protein
MRAGSSAGNATRACHAATPTATTALAHACSHKTPEQDRQGHEGKTCIQTARTIQRLPIALYAATSPVGRIGAVVAGVPGGLRMRRNRARSLLFQRFYELEKRCTISCATTMRSSIVNG